MSDPPDAEPRRDPSGADTPLEAAVTAGVLSLRIGIHTLAHSASYAEWANPWDDARQDYIRTFAIADAEEFARDVKRAMLDEREDGSSPLTDFIDKAMQAAVEDGSLGLSEDEVALKPGEMAACETWEWLTVTKADPAPASSVVGRCTHCGVFYGRHSGRCVNPVFVDGHFRDSCGGDIVPFAPAVPAPPVGGPLRALVALRDEIRSIAIVAGQCSVEGLQGTASDMAGAEAERCTRWADELDAALAVAAPLDITNHHNALTCPYCNPKGLVLCAQPHGV